MRVFNCSGRKYRIHEKLEVRLFFGKSQNSYENIRVFKTKKISVLTNPGVSFIKRHGRWEYSTEDYIEWKKKKIGSKTFPQQIPKCKIKYSFLSDQGVNLQIIKDHGGWESSSITEYYTECRKN